MAHLLQPPGYKMHSIFALTQLLPYRVGIMAWAILSLTVIGATVMVWRQTLSWRARFGVLVLASALVDPHLTIYDTTVMALPILWLGGWLGEQQDDTVWFWQRVYLISAALLIPTAIFIKVQLSVILISELFARVVWVIYSGCAPQTLAQPLRAGVVRATKVGRSLKK